MNHQIPVNRSAKFLVAVCAISVTSFAPLVSAQDADTQETDQLVIEEVIVTAQKRSESLQDVPIAISALSEEFLTETGASNLTEIMGYTPGFTGTTVGGATSFWAMRGISTTSFDSGSDPSVGVYQDEAYIGRNLYSNSAFFDVNRIEVIKGPQGTLFGRNAVAGAINIITNRPVFNNEGRFMAGLGNEGQRKLDFAANFAPSDRFALRLSGILNEHDGYQTNTFNGLDINNYDEIAGRLGLRFDPSERVTTYLMVQHYEFDGRTYYGPNASILGERTPDAFGANIDPRPGETLDNDAIDLRIEWDLDNNMALTSITDYRSADYTFSQDVDGVDFWTIDFIQPDVEAESFSQELRLNGQSGAFDWLLGGSYFNEDQHSLNQTLNVTAGTLVDLGLLPPDILPPDFVLSDRVGNETEATSYALYGDLGWQINEQWKLSGGARWTDDKKDWLSLADVSLGLLGAPLPPQGLTASNSWSDISPRLAIDYTANDDVLLYGSVSRGYKGGGFNTATDGENVIGFDPEEVTAYEVGMKSTLAQDTVKLNAALFFNDYTDLQVQTIVNGLVFTSNAAAAEVKGLEVEAEWLTPLDGLSLQLAGTLTDHEFTSGELAGIGDVSGNKLVQTPDSTLSLVARHALVMGSGARLDSFLAWNHQSRIYFDASNRIDLSQGSYGLLNGRVRYTAPSGSWDLSLVGENLTDERFVVIAQDPVGVGAQTVMGRPRFVRLEFSYYYGN